MCTKGIATLVAALLCVGACACAPPDRPPARRVVRFTIGTPGGGIYALGRALATRFQSTFPDLDIEVHERSAAVSNLAAVARGEADLTFAYADVVYTEFAGEHRRGEPALDQVRAVAVLQIAPIHVVAGAHVKASGIGDLAGLRVGLGQPLSSTEFEGETLLHAHGIPRTSARVVSLPFDEAAQRLTAGRLDAFFLVASSPADAVTRALASGARLLPVEGPAVDALRQDSAFLQPTVIDAGTYPGQTKAIHTVGVHNVLVCRRDLDEALVHDLTRRFFELLPSLVAEQSSLREVDLPQAAATPIPLHPGAARYYRERELAR